MDRHECRHCGRKFNYCRSCVLKPIPWRAAGFCSRECSAAFKAAQNIEEVVPVENVEVVVIEEDTSTQNEDAVEYPCFFAEPEEMAVTPTEDVKTKKKRAKQTEEIQKENGINDDEQNYGEDI